jgi:hypothetical protein
MKNISNYSGCHLLMTLPSEPGLDQIGEVTLNFLQESLGLEEEDAAVPEVAAVLEESLGPNYSETARQNSSAVSPSPAAILCRDFPSNL